MEWFRMYGDMPDDPKIGTLSDSEFRTWVEMLCIACKADAEGNTKLTSDTVNWALRRDVTCDVTALSQRELVTVNGDGEYVIKAWEKRQYKTDSSTKRTREYRERKKSKANNDAACPACDVTVTDVRQKSDVLEQNRTEYIKPLSDKSDGAPKDSIPNTTAREALDYLNLKTGAHYRPVEANLKLVRARLAEGATMDEIKSVIDMKARDWGGTDSAKYLRPETLFNATKYNQYVGQVGLPLKAASKPRELVL